MQWNASDRKTCLRLENNDGCQKRNVKIWYESACENPPKYLQRLKPGHEINVSETKVKVNQNDSRTVW